LQVVVVVETTMLHPVRVVLAAVETAMVTQTKQVRDRNMVLAVAVDLLTLDIPTEVAATVPKVL
jgi:hypothetical protein